MSDSIIDFGRVCRGESRVRKLTLRNTGALGTELTIRKVGGVVVWEWNEGHGQCFLLLMVTPHLSMASASL